MRRQEYDKAIADLTEAVRLDPKNIDAFCSRSDAWRKKREYKNAIADATEAIRIDPRDGWAYYRRHWR